MEGLGLKDPTRAWESNDTAVAVVVVVVVLVVVDVEPSATGCSNST